MGSSYSRTQTGKKPQFPSPKQYRGHKANPDQQEQTGNKAQKDHKAHPVKSQTYSSATSPMLPPPAKTSCSPQQKAQHETRSGCKPGQHPLPGHSKNSTTGHKPTPA